MAPRSLPTALRMATALRRAVAGSAVVAAMAGTVVLHPSSARGAAMGAPKVLPYPEAVTRTHTAAEAVLAGAGAETCLRGKLTNALLGLSSSCEAKGERNPLCQLADSASVVTPMTLAFMRDTATRLLTLIDGGAPRTAAPGSPEPSLTQP